MFALIRESFFRIPFKVHRNLFSYDNTVDTFFDKKVPFPHFGIFNAQIKEPNARGKRHDGSGREDTQ